MLGCKHAHSVCKYPPDDEQSLHRLFYNFLAGVTVCKNQVMKDVKTSYFVFRGCFVITFFKKGNSLIDLMQRENNFDVFALLKSFSYRHMLLRISLFISVYS